MALEKYSAGEDSIESQICGIPCIVRIDTFNVVKGDRSTWASDLDYYGYTDIEFSIFDRKGYKANWLESKLDMDEIQRIEIEIMEAHNPSY